MHVLSAIENFFVPLSFIPKWTIDTAKTVIMAIAMDKLANKPVTQPLSQTRKQEWSLSLLAITASTDLIKTVTHMYCLQQIYMSDLKITGPLDIANILVFRPFVFELIFDLIHYCVHRGCHAVPVLYRNIHKYHHSESSPSAYTSFKLSPPDVILSYSIPFLITFFVTPIPYTNPYEIVLLCNYMKYQEIGGHLGKKLSPTSSFPQFVWLPRCLGIQLYTEDHDLHHQKINCNYSKRFRVWDKIFGTYKQQ